MVMCIWYLSRFKSKYSSH